MFRLLDLKIILAENYSWLCPNSKFWELPQHMQQISSMMFEAWTRDWFPANLISGAIFIMPRVCNQTSTLPLQNQAKSLHSSWSTDGLITMPNVPKALDSGWCKTCMVLNSRCKCMLHAPDSWSGGQQNCTSHSQIKPICSREIIERWTRCNQLSWTLARGGKPHAEITTQLLTLYFGIWKQTSFSICNNMAKHLRED